jgi:hypothetical protein
MLGKESGRSHGASNDEEGRRRVSAAGKDGQRWGRWEYKASNLTLVLDNEGWEYEVDLEECNNSAEILDWIVQVSQKAFAKSSDVGDLVRALDDLADGLQDKV